MTENNSDVAVSSSQDVWHTCLARLREEFPTTQFDTWIKPLQACQQQDCLYLFAPNQFVQASVCEQFLPRIEALVGECMPDAPMRVVVQVGSYTPKARTDAEKALHPAPNPHGAASLMATSGLAVAPSGSVFQSNLNPNFLFENFVTGKSNQMAKAGAQQVAEHHGKSYNPLFLYGAVGLGKTHLMHAVGNAMLARAPHLRVLYLHSERFVSEMIRALQANKINEFKESYRSVNALFIDDIQFFAGKERSQEELFHIFNALSENGSQMVFTCDCYPKEISGLEERLKSRFGWGLTVAVEPPELETRVAILLNKAAQGDIPLSDEAAFFIAKRVRSNVRELEGALKRVVACAEFMGRDITIDLAKEALKDLIALQSKLITIENIQKTVCEYYKIRVADILSKRRSRSVTRPRQMAMALTKELTNHSLPEIGDAFGGRDHTTVLHACRQIELLRESTASIREDWQNLMRVLST